MARNRNAADAAKDEQKADATAVPEVRFAGEKESDAAGTDRVLKMLEGIVDSLGAIDKRVSRIEKGGSEDFKEARKAEDVARVADDRSKIDPKIVAIVDEMLGEDFGIQLKPLGDRPGFRFTLIVPQRLSDNVSDKRPVRDPATGEYKKNAAGEVIFEDYYPEDRRSRIVSSLDSYDTIKKHCDLVRGHIVSFFQRASRPLPEFRVR